jgi:hypothetical protein
MRVLDLDLDFFLNNVCELAEYGRRPDISQAQPWPEDKMRAFLEDQCGLSRNNRIPGRIFETHDQALDFWQARAAMPIHVTHVDAHSDLGIGRPGPAYVLESVITRPPEARGSVESHRAAKKLDEANYLLFALAFRWVKSLDNVRNPASRPDLPPQFCLGDHIRLCSSVGALIPALDRHEPVIPFANYDDYRAFRAPEPYDLASLAISPRYAPAQADRLAEVFAEYVTL